ncbi:hypothetical protein ACIHFB_40580 [Streptomyces sp. NPDC051963]|uniref:hypothetical protein n=1 Tax=Streptomyces sp. NPDC051963 TaxID=3365678 RepID=UPI0037D65029
MDDADGAPIPDFLDRLIARHAAPAATPRPGVVRVQPRLPGPFERIEAVRAGAPDPDGTGPLWPAPTPSAVPQRDVPRPAPAPAGLRTERERTVVRTERVPADPVVRSISPAEAPLLRPATPVAPGPRPVPDGARRSAARGRSDRDGSQTAASVPIPPGTDAAHPTAVSAALRPSAAESAAARDAVRQAGARRPGRAVEQVVQVQIGRLEVTASSSPTGGPGRRTESAARPGATVSLAEYLARGRT